ncbi:MAG: Hsp20/alpha crystallin family protein [Candidatus Helarchaeota archaeon]|nr:Hsp20/alpha crystallin family protein [Candidatus Helarchaeota archaeon]
MTEKKRFIDRMREFFADIEKDIYQAFGELIEEKCSWDPEECCLEPLTNVIETEDEILITADLPYVKKDNIDIHVTDDMLDLQATLERPVRFAQWGTIQRNTEFHKFHKHVKLSSSIDPDKIIATFKGGILQIRMPKKVTRIRINIE